MYRFAATLLSAVFVFGASGPTTPPTDSSSPSSSGSTSSSAAHTRQTPQQSAAGKTPSDMPPSERDKLELRGDVFMARKMFPEALQQYEQLLTAYPKDAELLNKVGVVYQQEGELVHAMRYYKRSIKADKNFATAYNNLGTVEYQKKHYGRSIQHYKTAIAMHPTADLATIYSNLGYSYFGDKQYIDASDSFQKAIALDPQVFLRHGTSGSTVQQRTSAEPGLLYYLVAKIYAKQGDAERCAHYLRMSRDNGYAEFTQARTDPIFGKVIKDSRVQEILQMPPSYAHDTKPPVAQE
jgi:tetratricopeptide (TPR) repeat protein